MPLSEHEQKMLDQLEMQLSEDPTFASQMRRRTSAPVRKGRVLAGALLAAAGLGLVLVGVTTQLIWVGVVGFVVMVVGGYAVATPRRGKATLTSVDTNGRPGAVRTIGRGTKASAPRAGGLMDRLAARWERRRRDGEL